ncbi:hypothetical protein EWM64_g2789 [Hericium alpestre]|uniref:Uncharacterized protein n=1 Tax=Hericium alpestre TaxID=135208 RepID=A0A4Z0A4G9_9AGAM|nr:hypothetical protein EWM64_g2789 [Hericium alpestre]
MKTPTSTENPSRVLLEGQELDQYAPPRPYELDRGENPLDHSKLKAAWEEMLSERFLTSQVTSVLPLYLSTIFQDYRAIPSLDILLPPRGSSVAPLSNSGCRRFSDDGSASAVEQLVNPMLYRHLGQATVKEEPDTSSVFTGSDAPYQFMSSWAPMHLARMVAMIKSCKENIWMTYEKLYGEGPAVVDNEEVRVRQKEQPKGPQPGEELKPVEEKPKTIPKDKNDKTTTRDDFETAWFNWERYDSASLASFLRTSDSRRYSAT